MLLVAAINSGWWRRVPISVVPSLVITTSSATPLRRAKPPPNRLYSDPSINRSRSGKLRRNMPTAATVTVDAVGAVGRSVAVRRLRNILLHKTHATDAAATVLQAGVTMAVGLRSSASVDMSFSLWHLAIFWSFVVCETYIDFSFISVSLLCEEKDLLSDDDVHCDDY